MKEGKNEEKKEEKKQEKKKADFSDFASFFWFILLFQLYNLWNSYISVNKSYSQYTINKYKVKNINRASFHITKSTVVWIVW